MPIELAYKSEVNPNDWESVDKKLITLRDSFLFFCRCCNIQPTITMIIGVAASSSVDIHQQRRAFDARALDMNAKDIYSILYYVNTLHAEAIGAFSKRDLKPRAVIFETPTVKNVSDDIAMYIKVRAGITPHLHFQVRA